MTRRFPARTETGGRMVLDIRTKAKREAPQKVPCSVCGEILRILGDGVVWTHIDQRTESPGYGDVCPGSRCLPLPTELPKTPKSPKPPKGAPPR